MEKPSVVLPVAEYLRRYVDGALRPEDTCQLEYPPPVWRRLGVSLTDVGIGSATLQATADRDGVGSQLGTVHGGFIAELADAAMGTAHTTWLASGQTLTTIGLAVTFLRPVWRELLTARAAVTHHGRRISHYACDITREDGKQVAVATCTVMTLSGTTAADRSRAGLGDRFRPSAGPSEPENGPDT